MTDASHTSAPKSEPKPGPQRAAVTAAEFARVRDELDALRGQLTATQSMVHELHEALMRPQSGHGGKSLLDRMAEVTIKIEGGERLYALVIRAAAFLAAVGTIGAYFKWGPPGS